MPVALLNPKHPTLLLIQVLKSISIVSLLIDIDADKLHDIRSSFSWPQRPIAVVPSPLGYPPNNASINDYLTTPDGKPLFKNHLLTLADNIDRASPSENGFCNAIKSLELSINVNSIAIAVARQSILQMTPSPSNQTSPSLLMIIITWLISVGFPLKIKRP
eukprot:scaffold237932_cov30-Cyclotella_meneghiniana.AAC.1